MDLEEQEGAGNSGLWKPSGLYREVLCLFAFCGVLGS